MTKRALCCPLRLIDRIKNPPIFEFFGSAISASVASRQHFMAISFRYSRSKAAIHLFRRGFAGSRADLRVMAGSATTSSTKPQENHASSRTGPEPICNWHCSNAAKTSGCQAASISFCSNSLAPSRCPSSWNRSQSRFSCSWWKGDDSKTVDCTYY
jgi:hypothetical protein